ncbi:MAG: enoyl-CoA hydratase-related protein [Flavobacteriaceae bacterium]
MQNSIKTKEDFNYLRKKTYTLFDFLPSNCTSLNSDETVLLRRSAEGVLYVIMNRPQVHNAFDGQQIEKLIEVLEKAEDDPRVKVIVLTGAGENFCAGGDLNHMRAIGENSFEENKADALRLALLMNRLHEFPKPTIARVNGAAYGGGVGLVCCCDMAFGTAQTTLCLSEVKIGMVPATIGPYIIKAIGLRHAHRFMLTAESIKGQQAVDTNFLSHIFEQEEFSEKVNTIAKKITYNAPNAVQISKALLLNLAYQNIDENSIDYTADVIASVRESEEGKEGLSAFLEKRKPKF